MKRNEELVTAKLKTDCKRMLWDTLNITPNRAGYLEKRKGYNTFGEMVDVLWNINKQAKKMGWQGQYTITLPLKGIKPIYKKTLK